MTLLSCTGVIHIVVRGIQSVWNTNNIFNIRIVFPSNRSKHFPDNKTEFPEITDKTVYCHFLSKTFKFEM